VNRKLVLLIAAFVAFLITMGSFLILRTTPEVSLDAERLDKAGLIYERAINFLQGNTPEKAVNALVMVVNRYPDSEYAEKALRKLSSIYLEKGDYAKTTYYYTRFLKDFPHAKDASGVRTALEGLRMKMMLSPAITEDSIEYAVQPGDTLFGIARKFNVTVGLLKRVNGLKNDLIVPGQKLKIIVSRFSILVDKSDNILLLKKDTDPLKTYTVSTGKDNCTPVGVFKIEEKMIKPTWYKAGAIVASDSEEYELGERWMGLSIQGYGIHGTSDESTIGNQITQGCVRMRNNDVIELYDLVPSGAEVEIVE